MLMMRVCRSGIVAPMRGCVPGVASTRPRSMITIAYGAARTAPIGDIPVLHNEGVCHMLHASP